MTTDYQFSDDEIIVNNIDSMSETSEGMTDEELHKIYEASIRRMEQNEIDLKIIEDNKKIKELKIKEENKQKIKKEMKEKPIDIYKFNKQQDVIYAKYVPRGVKNIILRKFNPRLVPYNFRKTNI